MAGGTPANPAAPANEWVGFADAAALFPEYGWDLLRNGYS